MGMLFPVAIMTCRLVAIVNLVIKSFDPSFCLSKLLNKIMFHASTACEALMGGNFNGIKLSAKIHYKIAKKR